MWLGEVMDDFHKPIRIRSEVGVEDADEFALGGLESVIERSSLEAFAIGAVDVGDGLTHRGVTFDDCASDLDGLIGGIVEHLDVEAVTRIFHLADGIDESIDDELFVEY